MSECQVCTGRAELFLCGQCQGQLRSMLSDLPWWIDRLTEAVVGHARLGDGGRGSGALRLKGDDEVLPKCTCGHPEHEYRDDCGAMIPGAVSVIELVEPDDDGNITREVRAPDRICGCREYVPQVKQAKIQAQFLAAGRVNARASQLLDRVQNSLTTMVRDACESRGLLPRHVRGYPRGFIGPLENGAIRCKRTSVAGFCALWLTEHILAIAADEGAGQTFSEIHRLVGDAKRDGEIVKIVNRPIPMRFLGPCPTWIEDKQAACGAELHCRQDVIEVFCRSCRQTHNADRLQLLLMNDMERKKLTIDKILEVNRMQPEEFRINERTLRWWRQHDKLKPRGFRRPDGREVITRHSEDDEPLYLWADVRKLRAEKPDRKARAG